jgi:hypothetical protein
MAEEIRNRKLTMLCDTAVVWSAQTPAAFPLRSNRRSFDPSQLCRRINTWHAAFRFQPRGAGKQEEQGNQIAPDSAAKFLVLVSGESSILPSHFP